MGLIEKEFLELISPSNCSLRKRSSLKSIDPNGIDWAIELIEIKNRAKRNTIFFMVFVLQHFFLSK
jgi:hypothetical protein